MNDRMMMHIGTRTPWVPWFSLGAFLVAAGLAGSMYPCRANLILEGVHVVPHVQSTEMKYRQNVDFSLGARVELFLRNASAKEMVVPSSADVRLRSRTPSDLLQDDEWAWHDLLSARSGEPLRLQSGALTVWSWNGKRAPWGTKTQAELAVALTDTLEPSRCAASIDAPTVWLSAVTFLGAATYVHPDTLIFHVVNQTAGLLRL